MNAQAFQDIAPIRPEFPLAALKEDGRPVFLVDLGDGRIERFDWKARSKACGAGAGASTSPLTRRIVCGI